MLKTIIIKISNEGIHLNPALFIPIQETNIPIRYMQFHTHKEIYWKVELLGYNTELRQWKVKVLDYNTIDTTKYDKQNPTKEVKQIFFDKLDWTKLETLLSLYQKNMLTGFILNYDDNYITEKGISKANPNFLAENIKGNFSARAHYPFNDKINLEFSVRFTDAQFKLGYVGFTKYIKELNSNVSFKIVNDYILPEFDPIKSWFSKIFKAKTFKITASISSSGENISEVTATSHQIDRINSEFLESIKYQRTMSLTKAPKFTNPDKTLFTAEDVFNELNSDDPQGNAFKQSEIDILNFLLDNHTIRNKRHLEYLSGSKQSAHNKLRFTLHPNFGFLFLIEGEECYHYVWELLNSHATYIWSIPKTDLELKLQYKRIESSINSIRDQGREGYKRAYRENHIDNDLVFSFIDHDEITSNFVDGFAKWKHRLNEKLI